MLTLHIFCRMGKDLNTCLRCFPRISPPENSVRELTELTKQTHHVKEIHATLLDEQSVSQTYCNCTRNAFLEERKSRDKLSQQ